MYCYGCSVLSHTLLSCKYINTSSNHQEKSTSGSKADWQLIKEHTVIFAKQFVALSLTRTVKEKYTVFIEYMEEILAVDIISKLSNSQHNIPWMNRNLKRLIRKKGRRFKQAKKAGMDADSARYLDICS